MFGFILWCFAFTEAFRNNVVIHRYSLRKYDAALFAAIEDEQQGSTERGRLLAEQMKGVNLYLVGAMGSGKSKVGDIMCRMLGSYTFVDTDTMIESATNKSISAIFDESGEDGFRDTESAVLGQVAAFVRLVISTGGGIVLRKSNWAALRTGLVVFLDTAESVLETRLEADTGGRPLLQGNATKIRQILQDRRPLYQQADLTVAVEDPNETPGQTAGRVVESVLRFIADNPPKRPPD